MDFVQTFAIAHPILATIIAIPVIGWSARIILAIIRNL